MTPKDIKKMQKNKEKEKKKREAKAKAKAKKKEKGKGNELDPPDNEGALELEQLQIPPKSVVVRLTKVEVQKMVTPSSMTKLQVRVSKEDKGETKVKAEITNKTDSLGQRKSTHSTQLAVAEDPRFQVQQAEIPRRYTAKELTHPTKTNNSDDRLNRRVVSGGVSSNHPHYRHPGGFARSRNSVFLVTTTDSQFGDRSRLTIDESQLVLRPSVSQPAVGDPVSTSRPSMRPANRESVSYSGASVLKGSERISDLASSSLPPQLPPRRSQVASKSKSKSEVSDGAAGSSSMQAGPVEEGLMARLVAGPSRSRSDRNDGDGDQAPPSYDELVIENNFTTDTTEKLK
ncbi:hypothetical protein F5890DRAFT_42394 [Lentinula detonsa]|uniref:Uncharacterized protein n=1 Tax=Lentinula detonsa TaxID=2804962 RepID=A0AA38Q067_9AGAR|nr:hypothetical protein F5890DRAFT_42394 [Lentinula detonsa]